VRRWYCPAGSPLAKIFKWRAEAKAAPIEALKSQTPPARQPAMNQNFELFIAS